MPSGLTGAQHYSLLNRLAEATVPGTPPRRFSLVTSWQIDQADPLFLLVSNGKGQILQKRLFTGSAVCPMGKVRDVWRGHLGLSTDDDLRPIIGSLVIMSGISEWHLEERLEARLAKAGLVAVDPGSARHAYADLAKAFIDQGNTDFDAFRVARLFRMAQLDPRAGVPIQGYNANLEYGVAEFKDASSRRTSLATVARRIRASLRPCAFHLSSLRSGSNPRR